MEVKMNIKYPNVTSHPIDAAQARLEGTSPNSRSRTAGDRHDGGSSAGTALVTGASSGIGAELAKLLAAEGYDLYLVARDGHRLRGVANQLSQAHGIHCTTIQADLSRADSADAIFHTAPDIDILINNAGFGVYGEFASTDLQTEMDSIEVNITSLTRLTKTYLPRMIERRRGRIMNVASMAALIPGPYMAVYYATKAYVLSFTEALSVEVGGTGVTVTAFCPGSTRTRFEATAGAEPSSLYRGRVMDPKDAAVAAYRGMMKGKKVVFAGIANRLVAVCAGATPRELLRWTSTQWNRPVA
jgi:short-subunit dehydrogenase